MVVVLPEGKQGPLIIDLTESGQMKQECFMVSGLLNMAPLAPSGLKNGSYKMTII